MGGVCEAERGKEESMQAAELERRRADTMSVQRELLERHTQIGAEKLEEAQKVTNRGVMCRCNQM